MDGTPPPPPQFKVSMDNGNLVASTVMNNDDKDDVLEEARVPSLERVGDAKPPQVEEEAEAHVQQETGDGNEASKPTKRKQASGGGGKGRSRARTQDTSRDMQLPQASVDRIVKSSLPDNAQVAKDARVAFRKAASVFILYLTATANDICMREKRTTLATTDVLTALDEIEFDEFLEPLQGFLANIRNTRSQQLSSKSAGGAKNNKSGAKRKSDKTPRKRSAKRSKPSTDEQAHASTTDPS